MTKETNVLEYDACVVAQDISKVAQLAIEAKTLQGEAAENAKSAEAKLIVAFTDSELAKKEWEMDIRGKDSNDIHETHTWNGIQGFHDREAQPIMLNGKGKVSTVARTEYTTGFFNTFYNIPKTSSYTKAELSALWTMTKRAVSMALKIVEQGMTARIADGKLVLSGGDESAMHDKARKAKSLAQVRKAFGMTESGKAPKPEPESVEPEPASAAELTSAVAKLCRDAIAGREALCPTTIKNLRGIVKLVTSEEPANVLAFTLD